MPIKLADESLLEKSIDDGENPVLHLQNFVYGAVSMIHIPWAWNAKCVVIFMQSFFQFLSPIANKYHEGKMKRTLKRKLKVLEIVEIEADVVTCAWKDCCVQRFCCASVMCCTCCAIVAHNVSCLVPQHHLKCEKMTISILYFVSDILL